MKSLGDPLTQSEDALKAAYAQIAEDRKTMRYGMVILSLNVQNDGAIDQSATNYREPCKGFLMIKKEVVLALLKAGLRWGGQDFGDMMHFDLDTEVLHEFLDIRVSFGSRVLLKKLGDDSEDGVAQLKEAAETLIRAAEIAGPAANAASLAGNAVKEDACWAVIAAAEEVHRQLAAAKEMVKPEGGKKPSEAKRQRGIDAAAAALRAATKVENDAKQVSAM